MLKRVEVPFPIYTPLPQLWFRQGLESIPSPAGLATGAHSQLSDSTAGAVPLPLGDPGDRLPGSAAGRPQPGPMRSPFPQSRFWFLPELQLLLHRGCACAWPWTLLIQTQIQTCSLSSRPDLRPVLSLWTCLETTALCLTLVNATRPDPDPDLLTHVPGLTSDLPHRPRA